MTTGIVPKRNRHRPLLCVRCGGPCTAKGFCTRCYVGSTHSGLMVPMIDEWAAATRTTGGSDAR